MDYLTEKQTQTLDDFLTDLFKNIKSIIYLIFVATISRTMEAQYRVTRASSGPCKWNEKWRIQKKTLIRRS